MQIYNCNAPNQIFKFLGCLLMLLSFNASAQSYTVSQSGTYSIEINNPTSFSLNGDDVTQIPIGFNFTFFGNTYTDCYVGGDGFITFGGDPGSYCCGQYIPDPTPANNLIAVAWTNTDFSDGHYEVFGTAPYRRLVITFDLANPCSETYYGQVKIFETTNVIEIHTQEFNQNQCQGWSATQGLENVDGTEAIPIAGRNFNNTWHVNNGDQDFVSFTPNVSQGQTYSLSQTGTYNIEIDNPTYFNTFGDDVTQIPIGFNFNFFGVPQTDCFVGGDGLVAFTNDPGSGWCCGQYIPDMNAPNNLIAAAWTNMDFTSTSYEIFGTAPYRRLVITLDQSNPCDSSYYGQIKLFETTNVIEIHTQHWWGGDCMGYLATQGLENADGTEAIIVPGRNNNSSWNVHDVDNDFVSFTPAAAPVNVVYVVSHQNNYNLEFQSPQDDTLFDNELRSVPLGFNFDFFGNAYSSCYLAQNGFLSFGDSGGGCCEGQNIPNPTGPNNLIAPGWIDATNDDCCSQGQGYVIFSHETIGTAPDRRFVAYFLMPESCGQYYRGEVKLFEGSNIIEVHTDHWAQYNTPCSNATQGIENAGGTQAYYYTGRNSNTNWSVVQGTNDVVRFTPSTSLPPADAGITWINHAPFCEGSQQMSAVISNLGGNAIDSVNVQWEWDGIPQTPVHFVGNIPIGGDTLINIGNQTLTFGQNYILKAWTTQPNGIPDGNTANDTLSASIHAGMTGTYTIGGSSPDYTTFTAAIADLQTIGLCDTVIMNVRPGTYTEQIKIPHIPGSAGKQITFRAENGDSTSVILQYSATAANTNYVVRFDSAHDVTFEHMTMNALGTSYARIIQLKKYSHRNTIQHCALNGRNATVSTTPFACIYSDSYDHHNTFYKNTIKNGSFGFYHQYDASAGSGSQFPEGLQIRNNKFIDFYYKAIVTNTTKGIQIHFNSFQSTKFGAKAIEINTDTDTLSISNNTIYLTQGNSGITLSSVTPPVGFRARSFNNIVNLPGTTPVVGFGIYNSNQISIYHNTVRTAGPYVFTHTSGVQDSVYNNVFANMGAGPVIYSSSSVNNSFDYNVLYTSGPFFGEFSNNLYDAVNLTQWQQFTGYDSHSISVNPFFVSATDLHITNNLLNGIGSALLTTPFDIDGQNRNATHPDPGADEFTPSMTDAGLTQLLSPNLSCNAEQNIKVVLSNLGTDTLHNVILKWSINGIPQTDVNYTQILNPEGDTAHVILAAHSFSNQPDSIRIWTSSPNGITDQQQSNDTLAFRYRLPLNGIYTIGGTTPDFITFNKAVKDLNKFKTCGPVTFRFRDGIYTEQVKIDSISTTSAVNTITFESESQDSSLVTIQNTNDNIHPAVVLLAGTDYVTFRHLGIKALPSGYADCIELRYSATHNTISHCKLEGYFFATGSGVLVKSLNFGGINEYLTIDHNYLLSGAHGVYIFSYGDQHEIIIDNNELVNQRFYGTYIYNTIGLYIRGNHISTNTTNGYTGINQNTSRGITEISGNSIDLLNAGDGMFLNSINFSTNNGIGKVYNNMVNSPGNGNGIRVWNSKNVYVSYNNCNITGSGIAFELVGGDSAYVKNNIFVSNTGKAYSSNISVTPHLFSDYNDLYSVSGNVGDWSGTTYQTLSQWQSGTGYDLNSMSVDPQFVAPNNLHVLADTLDGAGIPIPGIAIDFDGNPRNATTPDIGADEIGANADDAGIFAIFPKMPFARGTQNIKAVIRNYGGNTITSVQIQWKLNNVAQTTFNYTGSLPTLQQDTVILGQVNFALSTPYSIKSWTAQPNGTDDLYNVNDTLTTNVLYAAVSDTLTVGGVIPDFANLSAALTAISLGGVLDSVHFQLRTGTYHALLNIPQTVGMNCSTPIVFESESGNAADVIWDNASLGNSTLILEGADGLRFRNLTIKTVQLAYHAVEIRNGSTCNSFINCVLQGMPTTSLSTNQATVYSASTLNHDNHFIGNTILNGSYGLYWDGGGVETGAVVDNNSFQNAYYYGCTVSSLVAPAISYNTVSTNTTYNYFTGIYVYGCTQNTIINSNQALLSGKRGVGINIYACSATSLLPLLASNNFIILGNSTSSYGIYNIYGSFNNIYNNTIRLDGGNNTGLAYYNLYGTNFNLRNNIFENNAGGFAMYFSGSYGTYTSDYNDIISSGANIVWVDGVSYPDLTTWQATGRDLHSLTEDPMFTSSTGYHITNAALNATAQQLISVPKDIQGELRDPLTPDIGCDEIALYDNDVGIISINYPKKPFPSGVNTVFIKFVNNGQDTLTSMHVDWSVDGHPQPTYMWTGLLPSAGTYDSLDIGQYNFAPYQTHSIKAWVSLPNTNADELATNDTILVNNLYPGLLGTYTIGGTNPDFDSLGTAINELNAGGAAGPVTFNIRTGVYLEAVTINDFPGSECNNPVIFKSESGDSSSVTITNLGIDQTTLTLNGADGVIFKNLTIESVNPAFRNAIKYYNGAHCNQFLNNHIVGYESNSTQITDAVIYSPNTLDTADVFKNNWIQFGSVGLYLVGTGAASHTLIQHNFLDHNYSAGIYGSLESGINIFQNTISNGVGYQYYQGVYLEYDYGQPKIERNTILSGLGRYGIHIESSISAANARARVVNNFVSVIGNTETYGMLINLCQYYDVFHNNVYVHSTVGSYAMYYQSDISFQFINNIFSNGGPGVAVFANVLTNLTTDYNDYHSTGSIGVWNGVGISDLDNWQTTTGQDAHSFEVNPQFMSETNLHITNVILNGTGQTLASVPIDIDGNVRGTPPDIGADEFNPSIPNDAGIFSYYGPHAPFPSGTNPVQVTLKNYGSNLLTSADIRWLVNGVEQPIYHWTGSLQPAICDTVILGNFNFAPHADHDFIFWSQNPNGVPDAVHVNDTLKINNIYPGLIGTYTVGGVLPDFNLFSQLEVALNTGGLLGDVTFNIRNGTYSTQLLINNFPRLNSGNKVTFQSEMGDSSLVTMERNFYSPSKNYVVRFSGTHHIKFQKISFSTNQGHGVEIDNASSDININHCYFIAPQLVNNNDGYVHIFSSTTSEDSVDLDRNQFNGGSIGIRLSASWGDLEKNVSITNNHFNNCFYQSIDAQFSDGLLLKGNSTYNTNINVNQGIGVIAAANPKEISNNEIHMLGGGNYGIYLQSVYGTALVPANISNNYIFIKNGANNCVGIGQAYGDYSNFNYNTVRLENTGAGSIAFYDYQSPGHINLRNCNFTNFSGGKAISNSWYPGFTTNTMDYCNLYTTGSILAQNYYNYANLTDLQNGASQNLHGKSVEPLFLDDSPTPYQAALDGTAIPIAGVSTDIYGTTRNVTTPDIGAREFTLLSHDIGAKLLVSPATYCGLGNAVPVTIKIQNYGASTETGFNVAFSFNGSNWTIENVGALMVTPGGTANYTFVPTLDLSQVGLYSFSIYTSMGTDQNIHNDTIWNIQVQHIPALQLPVSNMLPLNGATNVEKPVSLSWNPAPNATLYDVYVWKSTLPPSSTPLIADLTSINTSDDQVLYGETYSWKVVAKNSCNQMQASPIQQFTVRQLPDLVVDSISIPTMAVSGQQIQIEWQVKNNGLGSTQSALWTDAVYLSLDATLNTSYDTYLGGVQNLTALQPNESYLQTGTFTIPQGFTGNYYVFVYTNPYNNVIETLTNNNWKRTTSQLQITLVPPPDLVIDQVVTPATAFSGTSISVHYTARNNGNGAIGNVSWKDRIKISDDGSSSAGGTILSILNIQGPLAPDSTYNRTINVTLPNAIFGPYYIYVETDILNQVYEQAAENNNYARSDTMNIILTPPPNLVVTGTVLPDTLHTNAYMNFNWTVQNTGGSSPSEPYWYDVMYLSLSPIYNSNFLTTILSNVHYSPLQPSVSYTSNLSARLPEVKYGHYYVYTYADRYNNVFEHTFENDNYTRFGPYTVVNPDMEPVIQSIPTNANAGDNIIAGWSLVNHGPGKLIDRYLRYRYFISTVDTFSTAGSQEIKTSPAQIVNLNSGDSLHFQTNLTLPQGLNDHYYLYILSESIYAMHEQNDAFANNVGRSIGSIDIDPGPYPDLKTLSMTSPDTVTAGTQVNIQYTQTNQGGANATTRGTEAVYISFSPTWDIQYAQLLSEALYATSLAKDSSVIVNRTVVIPANMVSNLYYLYIFSDKNNIVFEYTGENNNVFRSNPLFVRPYPPVDIAIESIQVPYDTLYTGLSYSFNYTIHNLQADPVRHQWKDAIYLSVDSTFNSNLDLLVSNYDVVTPAFMPGSLFPVSKPGQIPNGIQGDYYVFIKGDIANVINDVQLSNNINLWRAPGGQAKKVNIKLSQYPDLIVSAINAPATAVAGQQLSVAYTIQNIGNGPATTWLDRIYLSSDGVISQGDVLLYEKRRTPSLAAGNSVSDTVTFNIPGYFNGNYYMIIRTDFLDELYEYTGENNNNSSFILQVTTPPPSDLIVDVITLPDSLLAGDVTTINWTTKNHGSFPAQGSVREIVYLSADTIWNVEDQVFGFKQNPLYLPPQSSHSESLTAPVIGVVNQNYYALVRTDALNNVIEDNEDNNISSSVDPAYIDVKKLYLDSLMTDSLHSGVELYYKLTVDPTIEGESILVSLSGDSLNAYNELFVSYNDAPTRGHYDLSNNKPLSGRQKVVIRNAHLGTYYILGYGSTNTNTAQEVKISARVMSYEILSVAPDKGSNTGTVTVVIEGSRLDSTYAVRLRADDSTAIVVQADTFIIVSSEKIIAKFNLQGVPPRFYNVECQIEPYFVAVLPDGFEVIEGMGSDLQVNWFLSPGGSSPRNRPVKIVLEMINNGNADVSNKFIRVYSPYGNVIAQTYDDLVAGYTYPYIDVPVQLQDGFENTLPPGTSVMYELFSWLHPYPFFIIETK